MDDDQRCADSSGYASDSWAVRAQELGAAERCDASGQRAGRRVGKLRADVAQLVEHSLGKGEVTSSILVIGSRNCFGCVKGGF